MESLDLELGLNALHYNSHFDSDFDSAKEIDEFSERIIERSKPKPAKIKREISRLAEPYCDGPGCLDRFRGGIS
jgi:hypothetical protein